MIKFQWPAQVFDCLPNATLHLSHSYSFKYWIIHFYFSNYFFIFFFCFSSKPCAVARSILSGDYNKSQQLNQLQTCEALNKCQALLANASTNTASLSAALSSSPCINVAESKNYYENNDCDINVYGILGKAIARLQRKMQEPTKKKFYLHTRLETHVLPLTNVAFDRSGEHCLTGSYDRTCRIINTHNGSIEHVLGEHDNVVFSVAYNFPKW